MPVLLHRCVPNKYLLSRVCMQLRQLKWKEEQFLEIYQTNFIYLNMHRNNLHKTYPISNYPVAMGQFLKFKVTGELEMSENNLINNQSIAGTFRRNLGCLRNIPPISASIFQLVDGFSSTVTFCCQIQLWSLLIHIQTGDWQSCHSKAKHWVQTLDRLVF